MSRSTPGRMLLPVLALLALTTTAHNAAGASSGYLTTTVSHSGIRQTTISGYNGVLVNFTNTLPTAMTAFAYIDLANSAGQTVYWNVGSCSLTPSHVTQCFVSISPAVPAGNYTASVFATTGTGIPVSTVTSVKVTV